MYAWKATFKESPALYFFSDDPQSFLKSCFEDKTRKENQLVSVTEFEATLYENGTFVTYPLGTRFSKDQLN